MATEKKREEQGHEWTISIEGVGDLAQAINAAELAAQSLYDVGHHIKAASINSKSRGLQRIRVLNF